MTSRFLIPLNVLLLAVAAALLAPSIAVGTPGDETTEDIIHMLDGRELHGQILEEKRDVIVFEYLHGTLDIRTKLTLHKDEIARIDRDVALADAPEPDPAPTRKKAATTQPDEPERTYGASRVTGTTEARDDLPSFYLIPMKGQMATDVTKDVYEAMIKDIRAHDPDVIVIMMECLDEEDMLYSMIGREETGLADFDGFRDLLNLFRDELGDIRQVLWVHDSVGVSSAVALAWPELYMTPDARLGGLVSARKQTGFDGWADDDVRGKMTAAFMSFVKGFLEYGGYSLVIADAMVRPEFMLSGSWKGREVAWTADVNGEYVVDSDDEETAEFRAKSAEDLCISKGTAENLDDLALLMGIREFRVAEGKSEAAFEKYREDWRRTLKNTKEWYADYQQYMGWANGEDALKYLGRAKSAIDDIIRAMERYKAVETRFRMEMGISKFDLTTLAEQLKERIRALRSNDRGGGGGGRGPGGGGIGGGG